MDLNILWFILIATLYTGFFVLEGFDFGVGMLLPFIAKDDTERRVVINTIGPHWDANEVWLITAGGATFAAFPHWYATLFSGFYVALFILLVTLILRGVAFEFRSKDDNPKWRTFWDWAIFTGSIGPAFLFGVAFANMAQGVPINEHMTFTGTFWTLLNPYGLLGGLYAIALFIFHGAIFLSLKTTGEMQAKAESAAKRAWGFAVVMFVLFGAGTYFFTGGIDSFGINPGIVPVLGFVAILLSGYFVHKKMSGWAFGLTILTVAMTTISHFMLTFPNVMTSSTNPDWSLTIYNASSSDYTLKIMSIVALIFIPVILVYQGWAYWIFKERITNDPQHLEY